MTKATGTAKATPTNSKATTAKRTASLLSGSSKAIPKEFTDLARSLEEQIGKPVWFLLQCRPDPNEPRTMISKPVRDLFVGARHEMKAGEPIALLLDSPGGYADAAYQIACLFRESCGGFDVIVPRYAKSAATLLALGADTIYMGRHAELGPLDAQYYDLEREEHMSSLDEVQALERLRAFALNSIDEATLFLVGRSGKKLDTVMPLALSFVADLMRPMFERVDVVQYTKQSRILKIAEEYASRLLQRGGMSEHRAKQVARSLVERYPTHGFFVDFAEAEAIDLPVAPVPDAAAGAIDALYSYLNKQRPDLVGRLSDAKSAGKATKTNGE